MNILIYTWEVKMLMELKCQQNSSFDIQHVYICFRQKDLTQNVEMIADHGIKIINCRTLRLNQ